MEKVLKPSRFEVSPAAPNAAKLWRHWLATFENFLESIRTENLNRLVVLTNYVSADVYELFCDAADFDTALAILQNVYARAPNEVYARHALYSRKQQAEESLDEYVQALKSLSKDCNYRQVSAVQNREEAIRDTFIRGLQSGSIRQRLLENETLDLQTAITQARTLDTAQKNADLYRTHVSLAMNTNEVPSDRTPSGDIETDLSCAAVEKSTCSFCGFGSHPRYKCKAREAICHKCKKKGHYQRVCRSKAASKESTTAMMSSAFLATTSRKGVPASLTKSSIGVIINHQEATALVDSGSTDSFIHPDLARACSLTVHPSQETISMATKTLTARIQGHCSADITIDNRVYSDIKLHVFPGLCADIILGQDWQSKHESITIKYGGENPSVKICNLTTLDVTPPSLFQYLSPDCKPIATKSRKYSSEDQEFISRETNRLLEEGIIEASDSPWRAQVVVTRNERHKKRLVIDYSQTINKFTNLDAYPLPNIDETVNKIAQYRVFSTIDLKSAYHQVPIRQQDKKYTAFEANNHLYQFCRIPFGVTNGVAAFQRIMNDFIANEGLNDTFAYLDDVTICGRDQIHHDENLKRFLDAAKRKNLVYNEQKCILSTRKLNILGSVVCDGVIKPDPERLKPLRELPPPTNLKSQKRVVGLFSYYSKWIKNFSDKIRHLSRNTIFPLCDEAMSAFNALKLDVEKSVISSIDESLPFQVETDASDFAIAATLTQNSRPVAFFSRMLSGSELQHSSVEKEASAIIEAVRKWKHYLTGRHFSLITDQKSVSYMFNTKHHGKIKNDKIMRWRIELSTYDFDIIYRCGEENIPADALSRIKCFSMCIDKLRDVHESLCHPGETRMAHFVRVRNLPFSMDQIRQVIRSCKACAECKPQYYKPAPMHLIKATQPFERLNMDFKGPLPTTNQNRYILTICDEYSRFPFAFPCRDVSAKSVVKHLQELFAVFGMPAYMHSDRGSAFMSSELKQFLHTKGIATSRTTSYNPAGNGQVEKLNGTIWQAITLALKTHKLPTNCWQEVLPDALHSIRTLLCTSTNETPHERLFNFQRRSTTGSSIPSWLATPGPVLLKRYVRSSKFDPLVDEVQLIEANSQYAHIRYPDGREDTVALKHLAPRPSDAKSNDEVKPADSQSQQQLDNQDSSEPNVVTPHLPTPQIEENISVAENEYPSSSSPPISPRSSSEPETTCSKVNETPRLRRSQRLRRPPDRYNPSSYQ